MQVIQLPITVYAWVEGNGIAEWCLVIGVSPETAYTAVQSSIGTITIPPAEALKLNLLWP